MTALDWAIVLGLNLSVYGYGVSCAEDESQPRLVPGGRALPYWLVGISMFCTSVDGGEYVAINGATVYGA